MQLEWMHIAWIYQTLFLLAVFYALREFIKEKVYGVRYKRWIEVDTGRQGSTILEKGLNSCKIMGMERTVSQENILRGVMYFTHDCVENLKIDATTDNKKWVAYCNTEEFDTVKRNTLLKQLLYIMEGKQIGVILAIVAVLLILAFYIAYNSYNDHQNIQILLMETYNHVGTGKDIITK